ncbi:MAG: Eco57I restriction-modification methylase domain-containing protein [Paraclostridium sp.]
MQQIGEKKEDNYYVSSIYENSLNRDIKKSRGIYYTPKFIVDYIMEKTLKNHDILKNPYPKVLDIACGCGNFLLEAYDILYDMFEEHRYELNIKDIHNHILSNCIYGVDIDSNAIDILRQSLKEKDIDIETYQLNIYCFDSLNDNGLDKNTKKMFWQSKFDYIIGNPPYIGHKNLDINYKKYLLKQYPKVYKDKADIYFCFYNRIIDLLDKSGFASVITPRYFLESPSGKYLREYILQNTKIEEIVDFNGVNVFKNISVASCIFTLSKDMSNYNHIDIYRLENLKMEFSNKNNLHNQLKSEDFLNIKMDKYNLQEDWIISDKESLNIYNKINKYSEYSLKDICTSFQGIITGCDKAFVVDKNTFKVCENEKNIMKKWVKNKQVRKYMLDKSSLNLIYSDDIKEEIEYPNLIKHIIKYEQKLTNRRECKKNIRKWYELQWGRNKSYFERKKIMYPYKCRENRFAIDYNNSFCSADVYSFYIKPEYESEFSYEYLVGILNSSIYDKYFKTFAKKMTKDLYDYYPNKVMSIKIFKDDNYILIESLSKQIINLLSQDNYDKYQIIKKQKEIDNLIKESLQLIN